MLEQADLLEAERMSLLIDFGKETVRIYATAKDSKNADALIEHLRRIYFIGYEEQQRRRLRDQVDELVRLSKLTYQAVQTPEGWVVEAKK